MNSKFYILIFLIIPVFFSGCMSISYKTPENSQVIFRKIASKTDFGNMIIITNEKGKIVILKDYNSSPDNELIKSAVEGFIGLK